MEGSGVCKQEMLLWAKGSVKRGGRGKGGGDIYLKISFEKEVSLSPFYLSLTVSLFLCLLLCLELNEGGWQLKVNGWKERGGREK